MLFNHCKEISLVVKAVIEVMNLISTHRASLAVAHGNG